MRKLLLIFTTLAATFSSAAPPKPDPELELGRQLFTLVGESNFRDLKLIAARQPHRSEFTERWVHGLEEALICGDATADLYIMRSLAPLGGSPYAAALKILQSLGRMTPLLNPTVHGATLQTPADRLQSFNSQLLIGSILSDKIDSLIRHEGWLVSGGRPQLRNHLEEAPPPGPETFILVNSNGEELRVDRRIIGQRVYYAGSDSDAPAIDVPRVKLHTSVNTVSKLIYNLGLRRYDLSLIEQAIAVERESNALEIWYSDTLAKAAKAGYRSEVSILDRLNQIRGELDSCGYLVAPQNVLRKLNPHSEILNEQTSDR